MTNRQYFGTASGFKNLDSACAHITTSKLKPIGVAPLTGLPHIKSAIGQRLSVATPEDQEGAIYISTFVCLTHPGSVSEWLSFYAGYTTGEWLGTAACYPFVDDLRQPQTLAVLICRIAEDGERTPFNSMDRVEGQGGRLRRS